LAANQLQRHKAQADCATWQHALASLSANREAARLFLASSSVVYLEESPYREVKDCATKRASVGFLSDRCQARMHVLWYNNTRIERREKRNDKRHRSRESGMVSMALLCPVAAAGLDPGIHRASGRRCLGSGLADRWHRAQPDGGGRSRRRAAGYPGAVADRAGAFLTASRFQLHERISDVQGGCVQ